MLGRLLHGAAVSLAVLVLAGVVLYQFFGLRVVPAGDGLPRLRFQRAGDEQARIIEAHRAAQRAAAGSTLPAEPSTPSSDARAEAPGTPGSAPGAGAPTPEAGPLEPARPAAEPPYWTDFRGPHRDGHYREMSIATSWPDEGLRPLWKQPVGGGYASFVAARGRLFTIEQRGAEEVAAAYDAATGLELWTSRWRARFEESMGGDGPRATPTWADGMVYVLGAEGELRCLDEATGRVIWRKNILEDNGARNLDWGMAASPLVVDDVVIVLPGGSNGRSVVAYNRRTGARAWSALDERQAYSSPMIVTLAGRRQLLVFSSARLAALDPDGGALLWSYPWTTNADIHVAQPLLVGPNRVFVSSGYGVGGAVIEISESGGRFDVREVWRNVRMKNKFTSSVVHEGFIYGLDESILACVAAATGELRWKGGRYGYGQLVLASGRLIVLTEDGDLVLVAATPESHQELSRFSALSGKTWNHPAIAHGRLFVRNLQEMAAYDLR
jgi:outer membrane protein assembly factor BamB